MNFDLQSLSPEYAIGTLVSLFLAILFLQSGLDKLFNFQANLNWLKGHFAKSFLKGMVPALLAVISLFELAAGICCAAGMILLLMGRNETVALIGVYLSCLSLIQLFFGQRIAQDYEGAATLVPYFIVSLIGVWALSAI